MEFPTQAASDLQPSPPPGATATVPQQVSEVPGSVEDETLSVFATTFVPLSDPLDLVARLNNSQVQPAQMDGLPPQYQPGDQTSFWVTNGDSNQSFQVQASLGYATEHVYFWIDTQVNSYSKRELKNLVETFEKQIYPTTRAFFGSEWTPGVDNDPHLYILYARGIGRSVSGYFSSADAYLPMVREYSNGHEMFLLNADLVDLGSEYAYAVLAHEFQHMIHWQVDRDEQTWMNEGLSSLAMLVNGYGTAGSENAYLANPDIQLTDWPETTPVRSAYYGASYLFMAYFLDRFGELATKTLVAHPDNGLASMDRVLADLGFQDAGSSQALSADDVFRDWVIASYLQDPRHQRRAVWFPHAFKFSPTRASRKHLDLPGRTNSSPGQSIRRALYPDRLQRRIHPDIRWQRNCFGAAYPWHTQVHICFIQIPGTNRTCALRAPSISLSKLEN